MCIWLINAAAIVIVLYVFSLFADRTVSSFYLKL